MSLSLVPRRYRPSNRLSSILKDCSNFNKAQRQTQSPASLRFSSTSSKSSALSPIYYTHIPYRVPYNLGLALQEHLVNRRAEARSILKKSNDSDSSSIEKAKKISPTDFLILQEHSPVFTDGRRAAFATSQQSEGGAGDPITEEGKRLIQTGADYHLTKRGGLVTYHGPGQITGYPILDLGQMGVSV